MKDIFSPADRDRLDTAVKAAEARTGAEIVLMVVQSSTNYRATELTLAALLALALPGALLPFAGIPALVIWTAQLVLFIALSVLLPLIGTGALLVGPARRARDVRAAAEAQFFAHGLRNTRERAAVLIFVSLKEHEAHILFDDAAGEAVAPAEWRGVAGELARGIKTGELVGPLQAASERAADLLSPHFPRPADDENELPDLVLP